ncbi:hypothetical protein [Hymenobacter fodinae]|uniref:Uncharacterized protein n=1 Tax=Hymenobacter fodinae TaxID=2510796 RepID=A0A4Z0PBG7_9BACT|nr:hypothetical protein [Hymenobacter fodinae]TGE08746.1 hypothetical protein EU556_13755 [Hymenobacter fodinae]
MADQFELPIPIKLTNPHHVDEYYGPAEGYIDVAAACAAVPIEVRYYGLTVGIQSADGIVEYWWRKLLTNEGLIPKTTGGGDGEPSTPYTLPVASDTVLGGVKIGADSGLEIDPTTGHLKAKPTEGGAVDFTPNVTLNSLKAGTRYQISAQRAFELATTAYFTPAFEGFTFDGVGSTTREEGTAYSAGVHPFAWGTSNQANIAPGGLTIRDITANQNLATGLENDGFENISVPGFTVGLGESRRYLISGNDTNGDAFFAQIVISGARYIFYGSMGSAPTTSAQVRALAGKQLTTQGNTFTLNTGNVDRTFGFWAPPGLTLKLVTDQETNATLTSQYVAQPFSVDNAGGTPVAGTLYVMQQAIPFSSNHRHLITLG